MYTVEQKLLEHINIIEKYGIEHNDKFILDETFELKYLFTVLQHGNNKSNYDPRVNEDVDAWDKKLYEIHKNKHNKTLEKIN